MQDNKTTINHHNSSPTKDFLWSVYKSFLIGLAVYLCYRCLHFSPLAFHIVELVLCIFITIGFTAIIKHHATAKKAKDYPDKPIFPSPLAVAGGALSWLIYLGLILYGIDFVVVELPESIPMMVMIVGGILLIIYPVVPDLLKRIVDPFYYLNNK